MNFNTKSDARIPEAEIKQTSRKKMYLLDQSFMFTERVVKRVAKREFETVKATKSMGLTPIPISRFGRMSTKISPPPMPKIPPMSPAKQPHINNSPIITHSIRQYLQILKNIAGLK